MDVPLVLVQGRAVAVVMRVPLQEWWPWSWSKQTEDECTDVDRNVNTITQCIIEVESMELELVPLNGLPREQEISDKETGTLLRHNLYVVAVLLTPLNLI